MRYKRCNHTFWSLLFERRSEGFDILAKSEQDTKPLTYSTFTGTKMHGCCVYKAFKLHAVKLQKVFITQ